MNTTRRCFGPVLAIAVAILASHLSSISVRAEEPAAKEDKFQSGSATVQALRFEPAGEGKRPAVILLHGADGWASSPMAGLRFAAAGLNDKGQIAVLIRYFDRTKTPDRISPEQRADFVRWLRGDAIHEKENESRKHFEQWMETVRDAVAYVRKLPNVDPDRVAIAGFSLGGYLALSAAPTVKPPVKAVVEMFGGLPEEYRKKLGKMPPTLIVHGEEDDVISVNEAYKAAGIVLAQKQQVVIEIHKGVGHVCCPPGKDSPDIFELQKARNHMTSFLRKQLEPERAGPTGK
jgi:carboxymethylenebutenolidase